ncbi:PAS domain S-box protein [Methanocella sp. MCL-LM]|uniref:PAS domain S-box protein n=1 Tax=Methanocella sp. MCL-LM TaxID=3412035 RepID=UPI003C72CCA5
MRRLSELGNLAADAIEGDTVAFISWYTDGRLLTASQPFRVLTGFTVDLLESMKWPDSFGTRETVSLVREAMRALDKGEPAYKGAGVLVKPDRSLVPVQLFIHKYCPGEGEEPYYYSFIVDTTERRQKEDTDRESKELLQMVMDNVPQRIFWKDLNSVYLGCNKHFAVAAGVGTSERIAGKTDYELAWTREEADAFRRDDREVMDNDRPKYHIIEPQLQADGTHSWLDTNKIPLHDERGNVIGILGTYEDITERMRTEEALRQSEEKLKLAVDGSRMGMWDWDLVTGTLTWSDRCKEIFGISRDAEISYQVFLETLHPEDREPVDRDVRNALDHKADYDTEMRILWKDGTIHWATAKGRGYYDAEGKAVRMSGMTVDITDRKRVELALKKREADLLFSQRIAHIGSWRWNKHTGEDEWSDEFFRILGFEPGAVKPCYKLFLSMVHPGDVELVMRDAREALAENRPSSLDYRIIRRDGALRYVHVEAVRMVVDSRGRPVGNFGTIQDITDRKQVELSLEDAKVQAEMYLDLMGHDINNLNQIAMGFLEIALETLPPGSPAVEYILKPLDALKNSSSLIQRVKKLQQTREGGLPLHQLNVGQLLAEVLTMYDDIPGRRITIKTAIDCNCIVVANDLLRDVFQNLIGNSVKHSTGPVTILVSAENVREGDRVYCRVSIEDNGPGIPDKLKKSLFDRFRKGAKKTSGRGLGLYLVSSLVEIYRGKVWVEDRVPGDYTMGVRFVVQLPIVSC